MADPRRSRRNPFAITSLDVIEINEVLRQIRLEIEVLQNREHTHTGHETAVDTTATQEVLQVVESSITPPIIVSNQNNYNPAGLAGATIIRVKASSAVNITGLKAQPNGTIKRFFNYGSFNITLKDASTNSNRLNRFDLTSDIIVAPNETLSVQYATINNRARWRVIGNAGGSSAGAVLPDGDYGDITVSSTGTVFTIDNDVVTYAKMQNVSAASKLIGRGDGGSGDPQEITLGTNLSMSGTTISASGGGSHTILDGSTHTDSAAQTVSRGSLIYGNSTPAWDELVIGASGRVLTSDGTDVAWASPTAADFSQAANQSEFVESCVTTQPWEFTLAGNGITLTHSGEASEAQVFAVDTSVVITTAHTDWVDLTDGGATTLHSHAGGSYDGSLTSGTSEFVEANTTTEPWELIQAGTGITVTPEGDSNSAIRVAVDGTVITTSDANYVDLTDGGATTLHSHAGGAYDGSLTSGISEFVPDACLTTQIWEKLLVGNGITLTELANGETGNIEVDTSVVITTANTSWVDLTDGGATTLHSHAGGAYDGSLTSGISEFVEGDATAHIWERILDGNNIAFNQNGVNEALEISTDFISKPAYVDDFISGNVTSGAGGALGWATSGTMSFFPAVANHPGIIRTTIASGTATGGILSAVSAAVSILPADFFDVTIIGRLDVITNVKWRIGLIDGGVSTDPSVNGIYFEKLSTDTNFFAVTRAAASETRADTGTAVAAATWYKFRIRRINSSTIGFTIDTNTEVTATLTIPTAVLNVMHSMQANSVSGKNQDTDLVVIKIGGLTR